MPAIEIFLRFIKAERTSDWDLHLKTVREMMPFFIISGHHLYAKSCHLYLQEMIELQKTHPDVHKQFVNQYHAIRRSEKYWAGLSTDLVIEQTLNISVKIPEGLTIGR